MAVVEETAAAAAGKTIMKRVRIRTESFRKTVVVMVALQPETERWLSLRLLRRGFRWVDWLKSLSLSVVLFDYIQEVVNMWFDLVGSCHFNPITLS